MTVHPDPQAFLAFNRDDARKLLDRLDHIHLVAIQPDAPKGTMPTGRYFGSDVDAALDWAAKVNGNGSGVYWTLNYVGPGTGTGTKPRKSDIQAARGAHCDLDPPKDGSAWDKAGAAAALTALPCAPSLILDTGNGVQPVWLLDQPARDWQPVEGVNVALRTTLGADDCHNIDRLMRLPGSVNYPNRTKRERGCVACMAGWIQEDTGQRYAVAELVEAFPPAKPTGKASAADDLPERQRTKTADLIARIRRGDGWHNNMLALTAHLVGKGRGTVEILAMADCLTLDGYTVEETRDTMRGMISDARRKWERAEPEDEAAPKKVQRKNAKDKEPSEDDVALEFTERHRDNLRFDHDVDRWFEWDGTRWRKDGKHRAFTYARKVARQMNAAGKANFAAGVERFARADEAHAVDASVWDTDPMLLGTPAGTLDLHTGKLRTPRPSDHITKLAGCAPESGTPDLWLRFLDESLGGDAETIRFIQQWFGYALTGDTREHALAFVFGPGGNGKSVLINTLIAIMGDYAVTAAMETFTASKFDRHRTELAMLAGARLVTASETEEGRAWAEAKVKQMTGGDPITANFMRQDNFTFKPQFKLTIAGNHAPQLANVDDAMKRRFNIVPFINTPANPDRELEAKLRAEHGRILAWAIVGCLDWQENGLLRPNAVKAATANYFEEQDLFGQWLGERCVVGRDKWELATPLFNSWRDYAREAGDDAGSAKGFSGRLTKRGFTHGRAPGGLRKYDGLALRRSGSDACDG
ncbi:phage/plasmid primase, P4 family [Novosphingobium sp.]|uniref:phage/plasmid primase, P4 family n=1 Tax=Novosphingobium sp. TaxID=1874826 RepID=UPI00261F8F7A|nr:phage/plasmid primase, P4 family [Novosphingobium sp.]